MSEKGAVMTFAKNILYHGKTEPIPKQRETSAGPLSLIQEGPDLRYIRFRDKEVIRRICVGVRDTNWNTILPVLSKWRVRIQKKSFRISFLAEHEGGGINFAWEGLITGGSDGTISYSMDGRARNTFYTNRISICVLYPIRECAGGILESL
jgi:hypothetical protein